MTTPFIRHQQEALLYVPAGQPARMAPGTTMHVVLVMLMSELQSTVATRPRLCFLVLKGFEKKDLTFPYSASI